MSGIINTVGSRSGIVGSDIYPAGHVIQTQALSSNNRETTTSSSWATKWSYTLDITPHIASSNIWLCATFHCYSSSGAAYFDFYKNASDVTETYNLSGLSYGMSEIHNDENWCSTTITFIDPVAENSTSTKTYSIGGRTGGAGTTYIGGGDNAGVTLTIMEIAT